MYPQLPIDVQLRSMANSILCASQTHSHTTPLSSQELLLHCIFENALDENPMTKTQGTLSREQNRPAAEPGQAWSSGGAGTRVHVGALGTGPDWCQVWAQGSAPSRTTSQMVPDTPYFVLCPTQTFKAIQKLSKIAEIWFPTYTIRLKT